MILKNINPDTYELFENSHSIGTISTYRNLFHDTCSYLKFNLTKIPTSSPFMEIRHQEQKPLQVMIESQQSKMVNFLTKSGFQCKRCCYEAKVSSTELKHPLRAELLILPFAKCDPIYQACCHFLYQYYKDTHEQVSPLTVTETEFTAEVPTQTGYYSLNEYGQLAHVAFTEKNEIAYLCSNDLNACSAFIDSLLTETFKNYSTIFFEADDTDCAASMLLDKFKYSKTESFNTYIYN